MLLSIPETAERIGGTEADVYRLIGNRELRPIFRNQCAMFTAEAIAGYVRRRALTAPAPPPRLPEEVTTLTIDQAATMMGRSTQTVRLLLRLGILPTDPAGTTRAPLIPRADLDAYIQGMRHVARIGPDFINISEIAHHHRPAALP